METADGGEAAKFTMCDRSKNSVVLANTIECFADFEPPWDSDMSAQLFEDALVNLTRDEGDGLTASVIKFRERFSPGPRVGHTTSKYLIVGDDPSDATLIHVVDVVIAAPVERVKEVIWDEFLARESKADGAEASRLHAIAEDEDIYRVLRTPPRGAGQEKSDSSSLQHECSARARSGKRIYASRALREMIARPKMSRNEWKTTEI
jgi:hypothetical protein